MSEENKRPLLGKTIIQGKLECKTGLHIGAGKETMEIGDIDNSVVRDPLTNRPYIPGSSIKGKIRCLTERNLGMQLKSLSGGKIYRHECGNPACPLCRIYGSSIEKNSTIPSRVIFRDLSLTEVSAEVLGKMETGLYMTEWKFENTIDRLTSKADPRNLERVPAGAVFNFEIIYDIVKQEEVNEDLTNILNGLKLLTDDYLGGNGSRGYGKVAFMIQKVTLKKKEDYSKEIPIEFKEDWTNIPSDVSSKLK